jgi:hypothetical protein
LEAFCGAKGLDYLSILAVGLGERADYYGWRRAQGAETMQRVVTGPEKEDFFTQAPRGRQLGTQYLPVHPDIWEETVKNERAKKVPPRTQVQPIRVYDVREYEG